jgi:hypothetical protein
MIGRHIHHTAPRVARIHTQGIYKKNPEWCNLVKAFQDGTTHIRRLIAS